MDPFLTSSFYGINPFEGVGDNEPNGSRRVYNTSASEVGPYIDADRWGIPDNRFSHGVEQKQWDNEQTRKRQYWQGLLGDNYDESTLGTLSDAPKKYDPYAISAADERAYLHGASPQNAQGMPWTQAGIGWGEGGGSPASSYGVGKQFTGQRPGWQTMDGEPEDTPWVPKNTGADPLANMTGLKNGFMGANRWRQNITRQPEAPTEEEQQSNLARLLRLWRL